MRYKSMPLSTRTSSPRDPGEEPSHTGPARRRRWWIDWLATVPILLLIPAILVPYLALGGSSSPQLTTSQSLVPGGELVINGTDFPRSKKVELRWDGEERSWLPTVKTDRRGSFTLATELPERTGPGEHELSAVLRQGSGESSRARTTILAQVAVVVSPTSATLEGPQTTPSATEQATPTNTPSETPSPTPDTTATADPTAAPTATVAPTAAPTATVAPPPPSGAQVGYGARVTGGSRVVEVRSLNELRGAIKQGNHVVLRGSGTWDLGGKDLDINVRDFTLDNRQAGIVFKGGAVRITPPAGNVMLRHVKSRAGDVSGNAQELDAVTVNAGGGQIRGLYFDHVEAWWGPDVTFAMLGDVADVTLDGVIIAGGLVKSDHPEAGDDVHGHSMGLNMTALSGQKIGPQRVTIYRSLIALNQTRNPQLRKAGPVDIVDSVIFGHDQAPYGDALGGLNIIGTVYHRGSAPTVAFGGQAKAEAVPFKAVSKDGYLTANSVYVDSTTRAVDYSLGAVDSKVRASSPKVAPSVRSAGGDTQGIVLGYVGARQPGVDSVTGQLLAAVRTSAGRYYNGAGYPAPNPIWP